MRGAPQKLNSGNIKMEESMLTREQIEYAKRDISHPVVQLFLDMQDYIKKFREDYERIHDDEDEQRFVKENITPLAERLDELDDFSLAPLDIVSIWSRVYNDFIGYTRYNLAATIPATYGTRGIVYPDWKGVVPFLAKNRKLPERLIKDEENQLYFWKRLREVNKSLGELDYHSYGTRKDWSGLIDKAYKEGNEKAKEEFKRIIDWHEKHKDKILGEIHENFDHGFSYLFMSMPDYIRAKVFPKK